MVDESKDETALTPRQIKTRDRDRRRQNLIENHGWKLSVPPSCLEKEDRAGLGGGLRCFRIVHKRDEFGNKIPAEKKRCGNGAKKGSFYCRKHGGGNTRNLIDGKHSGISGAYKGAFKTDLGELFEAFLNDPTLLDLKPELAALKTCFRAYIKKVSADSCRTSPMKGMKVIKTIQKDPLLSTPEKWIAIRRFCDGQAHLTDGDTLDRINNIIDTMGRLSERIDKVQNKDEFMLTVDGLKILFRCVIDSVKENIKDESILKQIKTSLLLINSRTQGDLKKYDNVEARVVDTKPL